MSLSFRVKENDLSVREHTGDGAILLALNLDHGKTNNLAGFAIKCTTPSRGQYESKTYWLKNRLSLSKEITSATETLTSKREDSNKAPFQSFHWTHYPRIGFNKDL